MASARRGRKEPSKPTFVFKGTVRKINRATVQEVSAGLRTAVVHVDEVIEANSQLADLAGQDVTVQLSRRARVFAGHQWVFHTFLLMFGEGVSVRAVTQEPVAMSEGATAAGGSGAVARKARHDLQDRFAEADVVVSGRVKTVSLPDDGRPVTEHDPKWRNAVVEVHAVHKGRHVTRTITVRFPDSTDVRWCRAPKFRSGQRGLFILKHGTPEPARRSKLAATRRRTLTTPPASGPVYTALNPADFQPGSTTARRQP
jgi:hypothetical protein